MLQLLEVTLLLVMGLIAFVFANFIYARAKGAPIVYADREAIRACWRAANLQPGELALDLGCGNARSLVIAAEEFGAKGVGIDVSLYACLIARWNIWRHGQYHQIKIIRSDLRHAHASIEQADVIYLYLYDTFLAEIEDELFATMKPGARIVSLAFAFKNHKPTKLLPVNNLGVQTALRIYSNVGVDKSDSKDDI